MGWECDRTKRRGGERRQIKSCQVCHILPISAFSVVTPPRFVKSLVLSHFLNADEVSQVRHNIHSGNLEGERQRELCELR